MRVTGKVMLAMRDPARPAPQPGEGWPARALPTGKLSVLGSAFQAVRTKALTARSQQQRRGLHRFGLRQTE